MKRPRGRRLRGLIRKEFLQVGRDPSSLAIAFVLPVFLLFLFGYGVSLNARNVPIGVVVEHPDTASRAFASGFLGSPSFAPHYYVSWQRAREALRGHRVDALVRVRSDFARGLQAPGGAGIQLVLNGVDTNTAQLIQGYVEGTWAAWLQQQAHATGNPLVQPVDLRARTWFNPNARSRDYLVPGLIAVIMTLIGALLTALVVAREWERGTMEALIVTPVSMGEILLGKLIPYFVLGMGGLGLSVAMALWLFQVPLRGSFWVLLGISALFLLVALGMGLLISILSRNQFVAGMIAIIVTFLPAFLLSGFVFDIHSMPLAVRAITRVVPARYYVDALHTVFLAGDVRGVLALDALALGLMAVVLLGLSALRSHKRLD
ncbi:MAG TPA: ABC transporter permease [Gammaproteobacteria bacterium]|nr:ABC transporter permease [Gammaproteobacteria bacterium]